MELRDHIAKRAFTPNGTIARTTVEQHPGAADSVVKDVQPMALAFIRATHGRGCGCEHCR